MKFHPSETDLRRFAAAELADEHFELIAEHVADCDECAKRLEKRDMFPHAVADTTNHARNPNDVVGTRIGPYKLLEELGEGGMGIVYLAEQTEPIQRQVALKVIKPGLDTKQVLARFEVEQQALAMMDHHNISRVLDAGTTPTGAPFFAMELVKGIPITRYCNECKLGLRERIELFIPVCQAIQHAHQKGIIHRDIKPSNVMIALYDGKPVPKVIDFGVAKAMQQKLTEKTMFTGFGQILGTLEYMSPEQAEVNQLDVDTRSDVYSLGALLYELVTGSTPIDKERLKDLGYEDVLRTIRETEPLTPSSRLSSSSDTPPIISVARSTEPARLAKAVEGDLDWIVMKALEKDRSRRYETANGLGMDLQRFLDGDAVFARPPSFGYLFSRFAARNRSLLATVAAIGAMLVIGSVISTALAIWAMRAQALASRRLTDVQAAQQAQAKALQEAVASRKVARANAYAADIYSASVLLERNNDVGQVKNLLDRHRPTAELTDQRGWEWRYLWQFCQSEADDVLAHIPAGIRGISINNDGTLLAATKNKGRVELWDAQTHEIVARRTDLERPYTPVVTFSPDGRFLALGGINGSIQLVEPQTLKTVKVLDTADQYVARVAFSPDGRYLASLSRRKIICWDIATGTQLRTKNAACAHRQAGDLCFSSDGQHIVMADNTSLRVFDAMTFRRGEPNPLRFELTTEVAAMAVSPDNSTLAYATHKAPFEIKLVDLNSGNEGSVLRGAADCITDLNFFGRTDRLWSASADSMIRVWDTDSGEVKQSLRTAEETRWLAKAPHSDTIYFAGDEQRISVWRTDSSMVRLSQQAHRTISGTTRRFEGNTTIAFINNPWRLVCLGAPDRDQKAYKGFWNEIEVVPLTGDSRRATLELGDREYYSSVVSVGGSRIAVATLSGLVKIIDVDQQRVIHQWRAHAPHERDENQLWLAELATFCDYLPSQQLVVTKKLIVDNNDQPLRQEIRFWSQDGEEKGGLKAPKSLCKFVWYSPDAKWAFGFDDLFTKEASLWSLTTGEKVRPYLRGNRAAFSPVNDRLFAKYEYSGRVGLRDPYEDENWGFLRAHDSGMVDAVFTPDGKRLITSAGDAEIRIWDVATRRLLLQLNGKGRRAFLRVSDDGNVIAARGYGPVNLWQAPTWAEIEARENASELR